MYLLFCPIDYICETSAGTANMGSHQLITRGLPFTAMKSSFLPILYSFRVSCALCLVLALVLLLSCSKNIVREYHPDGSIREITYIGNDGKNYRLVFSHDTRKNTIAIERLEKKGNRQLMEMKVKYSANGKISFISRNSIVSPESPTRDIQYDSFTYTKSGHISKIETSYKSSYSISRNKTALITTTYRFKAGNISDIRVDGGTFRKSMKPGYEGNELRTMEYKLSSFNWKARAFQTKKHLEFKFNRGDVVSAVDKKDNSPVSRGNALEIYATEEIGVSLFKALFAVHYSEFIENAERLLIKER